MKFQQVYMVMSRIYVFIQQVQFSMYMTLLGTWLLIKWQLRWDKTLNK